MRVLLFGIDGLAFRVLDPYIERGLLPNFQLVREGGVQGVLKSTIPPMTPPAWMSIATGMSPSKHGVYDFWEYERTATGQEARIVTRRRGGKAIWNVLSDWGKQVIIANVPLTYPPEPVNGIMLSGYMAPDMEANVTYPAGFKDELLQSAPAYQIDLNPAVSGGQIGDVLDETLAMTRERLAMFRLVLDKPWDFCFLACSGADRIQHLRWDEIMAFHPQAVAYYQMLDEALGMMLTALNPEDLLLIVSDHGFQGVRRKFYIQEFLYRHGYLHMRDGKKRRRAVILGLARNLVLRLNLQTPARFLRSLLRTKGMLAVEKEQHAAKLPDLDWHASQAWVPSSSGFLAGYADIFLADSLSEEAIDRLVAALRDIRDPETGEALVTGVYREDVYGKGGFAPAERHIIVLANELTTLSTELGRSALWETSDVTTGIHHPDGVLYLIGGGTKQGQRIAGAHVYDVVPTILTRMGVPLAEDLDGHYLEQAFAAPPPSSSHQDGVVLRKLNQLRVRETDASCPNINVQATLSETLAGIEGETVFKLVQ